MTQTTELVLNEDFLAIQKAVEVSREMQAVLDAAYEKIDALQEAYREKYSDSCPVSRLTINSREVSMNSRRFLKTFKTFSVEKFDEGDKYCTVYVNIDGLKVRALLRKDELAKALEAQGQ